ncbi:MAG: histidine--tRNA ligase [Candidatus Krumholzibacteriia bacterium]
MRFKRQRGTQDVLPEQAVLWHFVTTCMRRTLEAFGYGEIRTPVFEDTQLFVRSVGSETDIVQKEMYTFEDRKGRSLTLRPEGTASVVRAYLENNLGREAGARRLFYLGPMFRYDRPQAGRYREFFQVGAEAIGNAEPEQDVEMIDLMMAMLHDLGLGGLAVEVNCVGHPGCRVSYEESLRKALENESGALCETCNERIRSNPLRVFDCKNSGCQRVVERLPTLRDHLCAACREHHATVLEGLAALEIPYRENPRLVRGLDYYTCTAFEVHYPPLGAQSALGGGGRYDGLVEACGGPATPAVGFSSGLERILLALRETRTGELQLHSGARLLVTPLGRRARLRALQIARTLRAIAPTSVDLSDRSLKAQLRSAARTGARVAVILGEQEIEQGEAIVRNLQAGEQTAVPWQQVAEAVRAILEPAGGEA